MINKICPYCKQRIEFEEGRCKVCAIKNHLWNCKVHRKINKDKHNLFNNLSNDIDEKIMPEDPEKSSGLL